MYLLRRVSKLWRLLEISVMYYCSIYNGESNIEKKVDLGILRGDNEEAVHFVLVKKFSTIFTKANATCRHVKMCQDCGIVYSTTEQLCRHYKEDHKDETMEKQILVLPSREDAWVYFNMECRSDFYKTLRYFFVCYADFECSNVPVQDPSSKKTKILMKQIPNSFMVFCPDLIYLTDHRTLSQESYLKSFHSDDPYEVVKEFICAWKPFEKRVSFGSNHIPGCPS
jgi:hypothetical protein